MSEFVRIKVDKINCPGLKEAAQDALHPFSATKEFIRVVCPTCPSKNRGEIKVEYDPADWKAPVIWIKSGTNCPSDKK